MVILYQDCSSHLESSKNMAARGRGLFSLYIYIEKLEKSSCQKPLDRFHYYLAEMFPWWPSTKIVQVIVICQKTWPLRGGAYFPYISISKTWKNLLVRNHWTNFNIPWQKCFFGDPLQRLFKLSWFVKKHGRQGEGLIFPIYIYIENLKKLLVRNHWIDFNITWQICFLGDPLPRLFKLSWFVKKHGW